MQYGNDIVNEIGKGNPQRLNRTMQYGNGATREDPGFDGKRFKSYYVVWKLQCRTKKIKSGDWV